MTHRLFDALDLEILRELAAVEKTSRALRLSPGELESLSYVRSRSAADLSVEYPGFVGELLAEWTAGLAEEVGEDWHAECLVHACRLLWSRLDQLLGSRSWHGRFDGRSSPRDVLRTGFLFQDGSVALSLAANSVFDQDLGIAS